MSRWNRPLKNMWIEFIEIGGHVNIETVSYQYFTVFYKRSQTCFRLLKPSLAFHIKLLTFMQVYVCPYLTRTESNGSNSERSSKLTVVLTCFPQSCTQQGFIFFLLLFPSHWVSVLFCSFDGATLSLHPPNNFVLIAVKWMKLADTQRNAIFHGESWMWWEKHRDISVRYILLMSWITSSVHVMFAFLIGLRCFCCVVLFCVCFSFPFLPLSDPLSDFKIQPVWPKLNGFFLSRIVKIRNKSGQWRLECWLHIVLP